MTDFVTVLHHVGLNFNISISRFDSLESGVKVLRNNDICKCSCVYFQIIKHLFREMRFLYISESGIEEMSQFYSELISEGDKLTIRSYIDKFCVKMSPIRDFSCNIKV